MLTPAELDRYREEGFLVCPGIVEPRACEELCNHLDQLIVGIGAQYAAGTRQEVDSWRLMRLSRGGIEVFWDLTRGPPGSLAPAERQRATMRVGHALHLVDPVFAAFCARPALCDRFRAVVGPPAVVLQSAVITKQPGSELVKFGMHQDAWYLTTEPESLALAFVALDDATAENGCLEVIPGSHHMGVVGALAMGPEGFTPVTGRMPPEPGRERAVPLPLARGSVVFAHGCLFHGSEGNHSEGPRRALIIHAMRATSRLALSSWIVERGEPPPLVPL
jgi:phytanoyl-CoA hydroxylase